IAGRCARERTPAEASRMDRRPGQPAVLPCYGEPGLVLSPRRRNRGQSERLRVQRRTALASRTAGFACLRIHSQRLERSEAAETDPDVRDVPAVIAVRRTGC